jgi:tRNA-dihydrouridine synthase A
MFGACLMAHPQLVAEGVKAMREACDIPVTVKHRIGIDDMESYEQLAAFIEPVAAAGCSVFIVHARKAWLQGLSPKENREIPPLNYEWVYQLKRDYPQLTIVINGGIQTISECQLHLKQVDGVMIGREAYHNPWMLAEIDSKLFGSSDPADSRDTVIEALLPYISTQLAGGARLNHITRHILGLYQSVAGARKFRRHISENAYKKEAGIEVLEQAYELVKQSQSQLVAFNGDRFI